LIFFVFVFFGVVDAKPRRAKNESPESSKKILWPVYTLHAETNWQINLPGGQPFNASGLFLRANGDLLTVSDLGPYIYKINFLPDASAVDLILLSDCFSEKQLAPFARDKISRYDCEGICE